MTTRDGDGLTYDAQQRLTKYAASEEYVYSTTNQRLIRQAGGTRTLYLPGMEVSVTGTTRTINCYLTIGATQVGTKTVTAGATSLMWACGNMQNSNVCQVTAGSGAIPSKKRYAPYGAGRQTAPVTFANTDRGFPNNPTTPTASSYLNNRYYDPAIAAFISVDPLVHKTGQPYLYANGSPASLSDPTGLAACADDDNCGFAGTGTGRTSKLTDAQMKNLETNDGAAWVVQNLDVVWNACRTDWNACRDKVYNPDRTWDLDDSQDASMYEAYRMTYRTMLGFQRAGLATIEGCVGNTKGGGGRLTRADGEELSLDLVAAGWDGGDFGIAAEWTDHAEGGMWGDLGFAAGVIVVVAFCREASSCAASLAVARGLISVGNEMDAGASVERILFQGGCSAVMAYTAKVIPGDMAKVLASVGSTQCVNLGPGK